LLKLQDGTAQSIPNSDDQLKTTYATPRRTVIDQLEGEFDDADLIANGSDFADRAGLHQTDASQYRGASRATRGKAAARVKRMMALSISLPAAP